MFTKNQTNSPSDLPLNEIIVNISNKNVSTRARVREHVNPLAKKYSVAIAPPLWTEVYADCSKPLSRDIGSARGR